MWNTIVLVPDPAFVSTLKLQNVDMYTNRLLENGPTLASPSEMIILLDNILLLTNLKLQNVDMYINRLPAK